MAPASPFRLINVRPAPNPGPHLQQTRSPKNNGGRHRCRPPLSRHVRSCRSSLSRAGRFRGAETRTEAPKGQAPKGQAKVPRPPGSIRSRSPIRFPRRLPVRAEALAVRRVAVSKPKLLFLPWRALPAEAVGSASGRIQGRSPGSAWQVHGRKALGHCRFAAPAPKPGPARPRSKPKLLQGPVAARELKVPLSAGLVLNPKIRCPACPVPPVRRPLVPMGALRSLPLSHSLRASPQLPPGGGFVSRPAFRSDRSSPEGESRSRPGLWLGRRPSVAGRLSRPHRRKCHDCSGDPSGFSLWIMRITCITSRLPNPAETSRGRGPTQAHAPLAPGAPPA